MIICIFCASSPKVAPCFFNAATELTRMLVKEGHTIVYGGGGIGLMGEVANTALSMNGKIIGVIPRFMREVEWNHPDVEEMISVETMADRKKLFFEKADAVIALPGGCGTLEELVEAISLKRLGKFTKPIVIFNQDGFYDSLITLLDNMIAEHFMRVEHKKIWSVANTVEEIVQAIADAPEWSADAIHFAAV